MPRGDSMSDGLIRSMHEVLGKQNRRVADKLAGLWGSPGCEDYLKALVAKRRDPDQVASRPFSVAESDFINGLLQGLGTVRQFDAGSTARPQSVAMGDAKSDFMVERRARPRPMPKDQVDVQEADTDSVWAVFNQHSDEELRLKPPKSQKYASVPEYPVDDRGHRLRADQMSAPAAGGGGAGSGDERFEATQPLSLDASTSGESRSASESVDDAQSMSNRTVDLNFSFQGLNDPPASPTLPPTSSFLQEAGGPAADAQRRAAFLVIGKSHPKIASQITGIWGQPECLAFLQQLVFDGYDQSDGRNRAGFKSEVVSALMVLLAVHPSE